MKIIAINGNIVVKPIKVSEKTKGGIILPESVEKKTQLGTVVMVDSPIIKEGDTILYAPFSLESVEMNGEEHLVGKADDIIGIVDNG